MAELIAQADDLVDSSAEFARPKSTADSGVSRQLADAAQVVSQVASAGSRRATM